MPANRRPLLLLAFLGCYALPAFASTTYTFSNIPYPLTGTSNEATEILNNGSIFGVDMPYSGSNPVPYSYQSGHFTNYFNLPDGKPIQMIFGNNIGEVAGTYYGVIPEKNGSYGATPGFIEQNGTYTEIPFLSKYTYFGPTAVNDQGDLVGLITDALGGPPVAAIYHNGRYTTLSFDGLLLFPGGINDAGEVVGSTGDGRGFTYNHGIYRLLAQSSFADTSFQGVNNLGQVVGESFDSTFGVHSFLLQPDGTYDALVSPPQFQGFRAEGINDQGQIVGIYPTNCNQLYCDNAGFVATPVENAPEPSSLWLLGCPGLLLTALWTTRHSLAHRKSMTKTE